MRMGKLMILEQGGGADQIGKRHQPMLITGEMSINLA